MPAPNHARAYIALFVIAVLWASYPAAIKLALRDMPPLVLAALRCTIASLFLVTVLLRSGAPTTRALAPGALRAFFFLGIVGIFVSTQGSYLAIALSTASNVIEKCRTESQCGADSGSGGMAARYSAARTGTLSIMPTSSETMIPPAP